MQLASRIETWIKQNERKLQIAACLIVFFALLAMSRMHPYEPRIIQDAILEVDAVAHIEPLRQTKPKKMHTLALKKIKPRIQALKPSAPRGWYDWGQCTFFVWSKRHVPSWNNASDWLWQAKRDGYTVSSVPRVGAIAWEPLGGLGHVAYVISVKGNIVTILEMNYKGLGVVSSRTVPSSTFQYIY